MSSKLIDIALSFYVLGPRWRNRTRTALQTGYLYLLVILALRLGLEYLLHALLELVGTDTFLNYLYQFDLHLVDSVLDLLLYFCLHDERYAVIDHGLDESNQANVNRAVRWLRIQPFLTKLRVRLMVALLVELFAFLRLSNWITLKHIWFHLFLFSVIFYGRVCRILVGARRSFVSWHSPMLQLPRSINEFGFGTNWQL